MEDTAVQSKVQHDIELRGRVFAGIGELLPRVLKRDLPEVPENACLFDDLGLTSAGTLELILELEESLDLQVDVEEIGEDDLRSVASLADFIAGHVIVED
ncbi:phosphopantetheine-binding protein [Streptacidiphilus albus]|uniref:phosphopantetheine-binding protein n=1 Tax=Streptacidiphilus albus TaxID=105425 RepID=UPI00054B7326|nr:phosphopantetheine-binding protein [Streptacidiphilus albus]